MSFLASYYAMNTTDPSLFWEIAGEEIFNCNVGRNLANQNVLAPVSGVITITALVFVLRAKSANINGIVASRKR
jgi:hypothetical protein